VDVHPAHESAPFVFAPVPPVSESDSRVTVSPASESEPLVAVPPVTEYEPRAAISPVSESESRAATVPSAVTRVMPIDEFFRLLVMNVTTPAFIVGERNGGQRQIDDYRQGGSQQSKP